jgi:hypothetical protein
MIAADDETGLGRPGSREALADLSAVGLRVMKTALRAAKDEGLIKSEQGHRYDTITEGIGRTIMTCEPLWPKLSV